FSSDLFKLICYLPSCIKFFIMRNTMFLLLLLTASCGQHSERAVTKKVALAIDTVMVDPGEDFIYMQDGASTASPDGDFLYYFNRQDHTLDKIDLEQLQMVNKQPFEKEGPNGTGDMVYSIHMLDERQIYLNSSWTSGLFQLDGTRTAFFNLYTNDLQGGLLQGRERLLSHIVSPDQPEVFFALVSDGADDTISLWKMDFGQGRHSDMILTQSASSQSMLFMFLQYPRIPLSDLTCRCLSRTVG